MIFCGWIYLVTSAPEPENVDGQTDLEVAATDATVIIES